MADMSQTPTHRHAFGRWKKPNRIHFCRDCAEVRVATTAGRLRELTGAEKIALLDRQLKDIAVAQAMQMIHGPRWREAFDRWDGTGL